MRLLIANGYVIDPTQGLNGGKDVLVEDGRVAALLKSGEAVPEGAEVFDATGLFVAPGFIDLHTHLREPGQEYKESIASGAEAAVAGGYTSVCAMPNTDPVNDNPAVTSFIVEQSHAVGLANVFPVGAITKGSKGEELAEMGEMKRAGIVAVTDDGRPVPSPGLMRRAMEYARGFDLTVMDHCDDASLAAGGVMHEGEWSLRLGLRGRPALAEESDAMRDCALAELTGARVHLAHVSTRGAIEAVRRAKQRGAEVTCEVTPHHFALTDAACEGFDTNMKMNPPLRSQEHVEAILEAIADGTIDAIATDHAPHHADDKELEFDRAAFGITGLETSVGLALERLVHGGRVGLERLVELFSTNPARIFRLEGRGTLRPGAWGDVTILDPELRWTFDASRSKSKSRNTPFDGWTLRGAAVATIVAGRVVYRREERSAASI
ncbi:MAG: dihydroorotase [Acidobacteriota bacterium]|jgi:dihydroorotase|nr:dihydroorotase [Acidobacteriota bacterium]